MSTCWEIKGSLSKMERRPATYRTRVLAIRKHLRKFPTQLELLCVWCHTLERSYLRPLAMTKKEVSSAEKSIKPTDSSFLLLSLPTGYPLSSMMEETLVHLETQYTVVTNVRWETRGRDLWVMWSLWGPGRTMSGTGVFWHSMSSPR